MKKLFSLLLAFAMIAALGIPALASEQAPVFGTEFIRVANDPTVEYDEWEVPYNVWSPVADNTPIAVGDTVTMKLTYSVPAQVEGYSERLLGSIEYLTEINGINEIELVEATGCDPLLNCDYNIGICVPVPGEYANITHEGTTLKVMAELGSTVSVIVRGVAAADHVTGSMNVTIGQHAFPAHFYEKVVDKTGEGCYNVHWTDFDLVQKRAVEFRSEGIFVGLNGQYYRLVHEQGDIIEFIPVNENFEDNGDPIGHSAGNFDTLADIYAEASDLFDIYVDDDFTDETFLGEGEHYGFEYPYDFGANGDPVDPTDVPADPTNAPADPTNAPADPSASPAPVPAPVPATGAASLALIGAVAAASGIGAFCFRRKEN